MSANILELDPQAVTVLPDGQWMSAPASRLRFDRAVPGTYYF